MTKMEWHLDDRAFNVNHLYLSYENRTRLAEWFASTGVTLGQIWTSKQLVVLFGRLGEPGDPNKAYFIVLGRDFYFNGGNHYNPESVQKFSYSGEGPSPRSVILEVCYNRKWMEHFGLDSHTEPSFNL